MKKIKSIVSVLGLVVLMGLVSCNEISCLPCCGKCKKNKKHIESINNNTFSKNYRTTSSNSELYMAFKNNSTGEWTPFTNHAFSIYSIKMISSNGEWPKDSEVFKDPETKDTIRSIITIASPIKTTFNEEEWFEKHGVLLLKMEYSKDKKLGFFTLQRTHVVFTDKSVELNKLTKRIK